jgi:hypothetical protein
MNLRSVAALLSAWMATVTASSVETVHLALAAKAPPSSSPPISKDFQSFSIEFSSWVDYAGETVT